MRGKRLAATVAWSCCLFWLENINNNNSHSQINGHIQEHNHEDEISMAAVSSINYADRGWMIASGNYLSGAHFKDNLSYGLARLDG